ncbi:MAG: transketolase, partial [Clostridium celatum]|nr:transketolase [Clostridium celatum]
QIDGDIEKVMNPCPIDKKFEAFGWNVLVIDGHNFEEIIDAIEKAKACSGKPTVVVCKTVKGKGVSFMENEAGWHGTAPSKEQCEMALAEIGGDK